MTFKNRLFWTLSKVVLTFYFFFFRWPFVLILWLVSPFFNVVSRRIDFEGRSNINQALSAKTGFCAFHVSSQGELEQSFPLIEKAIGLVGEDEVVEIIYTSESVQSNILDLVQRYPSKLSCFPLRLLSINPLWFRSLSRKISSKTVVMCRYDFFPELLFLRFSKNLLLINARVKKKGFFYMNILRFFDGIVASTKQCQKQIESYGHLTMGCADFRAMRISKRQTDSINSDRYNHFKKICNSWGGQVFCLGSTWESDLKTIGDLKVFDSKNLYFLFPHNISEKNIVGHFSYLPTNSVKVGDIESFDFSSAVSEGSRVFVITQMGVLCDLYPYFDIVYVGGGFDKSIHSVLEPYVSGAKVLCGPNVHRSSEFEYIKAISPDRITILKNLSQLTTFTSGNDNVRGLKRLSFISSFLGEHEDLVEKVISYGR